MGSGTCSGFALTMQLWGIDKSVKQTYRIMNKVCMYWNVFSIKFILSRRSACAMQVICLHGIVDIIDEMHIDQTK